MFILCRPGSLSFPVYGWQTDRTQKILVTEYQMLAYILYVCGHIQEISDKFTRQRKFWVYALKHI